MEKRSQAPAPPRATAARGAVDDAAAPTPTTSQDDEAAIQALERFTEEQLMVSLQRRRSRRSWAVGPHPLHADDLPVVESRNTTFAGGHERIQPPVEPVDQALDRQRRRWGNGEPAPLRLNPVGTGAMALDDLDTDDGGNAAEMDDYADMLASMKAVLAETSTVASSRRPQSTATVAAAAAAADVEQNDSDSDDDSFFEEDVFSSPALDVESPRTPAGQAGRQPPAQPTATAPTAPSGGGSRRSLPQPPLITPPRSDDVVAMVESVRQLLQTDNGTASPSQLHPPQQHLEPPLSATSTSTVDSYRSCELGLFPEPEATATPSSVFLQLEQTRAELERALGEDAFLQSYQLLQELQEAEDDEAEALQQQLQQVLGEQHAQCYHKLLHLVVQDCTQFDHTSKRGMWGWGWY